MKGFCLLSAGGLDDLKKPKLHQKAGESLQQILSKNPHVDFAALCNYVRQSQI